MPATLKLESITADGRAELAILESGSLVIGRDSECSLVVDSESVSRRHACIMEAGSQWVFRDFGSTNGCWLNSVKLHAEQLKVIRDGDILQLADFLLAISEIKHGVEEQVHPSLLVFEGDEYSREVVFDSELAELTVGPVDADIELGPGAKEVFKVERTGARLELSTALQSIPIMVNGIAVRGQTLLGDRDEISVGTLRILVNSKQKQDRHHVRPGDSHVRLSAAQNFSGFSHPAEARASAMQGFMRNDTRDEWESEASRRRMHSGRPFVFGMEDESRRTLAGATQPPYTARTSSPSASDEDYDGFSAREVRPPARPVMRSADRLLLALGIVLVAITVITLVFLAQA